MNQEQGETGTLSQSRDPIREQLHRILASAEFRSAPQLGIFLSFVVERTIEGRPETIKGYTIATEALGRSPDFDPQADPIVRVEATRLRRALASYYAKEGSGDPVVITVPRGGYVPSFAFACPTAVAPLEMPEAVPPPVRTQSVHFPVSAPAMVGLAVGLALGLMALAGFALGQFLYARPSDREVPGAPVPVVVVRPVANATGQGSFDQSARDLRLRLIDAVARFDEIMVLDSDAEPPTAATGSMPLDGSYALESRIENAAAPLLRIMLTHVGSREVVWSRSAEIGTEVLKDAAVREIASAIAEPYGLIQSHALSASSRSGDESAYSCLMDALDYLRARDRARHEGARDCLEKLARSDVAPGRALALLAFLYLDEHRFGYNRRDGSDPLDDALASATRAVAMRPESARARQALCEVDYFRGEATAAVANCEKAIRLNPFDSQVRASLGAHLIVLGKTEQGLALLDNAIQSGPGHPVWYHAVAVLGCWRAGDREKLELHAARVAADESPLGLIARAIAATERGKKSLAAASIEQLIAIQPEFRTEPRQSLQRIFPDARFSNSVLAVLSQAGLSAGRSQADTGASRRS